MNWCGTASYIPPCCKREYLQDNFEYKSVVEVVLKEVVLVVADVVAVLSFCYELAELI